MIFWAWAGALVVGITLGLLGSGGSILTVPVLVYLVGVPDKLAIAESLGIVMVISVVGVVPFALKNRVEWRSVLLFGVPAMAGSYGGAYLSTFISGALQLAIFGAVMLLAAIMMFLRKPEDMMIPCARHAAWKIAIEGVIVGVITGLVGVGGGFLIVPALVLLGGLSMHLAVGTSLAIIAINSASGFYKYTDVMREAGLAIDWDLILLFGGIGIAGSLAGRKVGEHISQQRLTKAFGVFLVMMGTFIMWENVGALLSLSTYVATSESSNIRLDSENASEVNHEMITMAAFFQRRVPADASPDRLTPEGFMRAREDGEVVIDVRTPQEFQQEHVVGAELINLQASDFQNRVAELDRTKTYYLYCRSGNRSEMAAQYMRGLGFLNVYNIGGMDDLARAGVETSRP